MCVNMPYHINQLSIRRPYSHTSRCSKGKPINIFIYYLYIIIIYINIIKLWYSTSLSHSFKISVKEYVFNLIFASTQHSASLTAKLQGFFTEIQGRTDVPVLPVAPPGDLQGLTPQVRVDFCLATSQPCNWGAVCLFVLQESED